MQEKGSSKSQNRRALAAAEGRLEEAGGGADWDFDPRLGLVDAGVAAHVVRQALAGAGCVRVRLARVGGHADEHLISTGPQRNPLYMSCSTLCRLLECGASAEKHTVMQQKCSIYSPCRNKAHEDGMRQVVQPDAGCVLIRRAHLVPEAERRKVAHVRDARREGRAHHVPVGVRVVPVHLPLRACGGKCCS